METCSANALTGSFNAVFVFGFSGSGFSIGLGVGFEAGKDTHVVIETNRGHNLGKAIWQGKAELNTGIPGEISGYGYDYCPKSDSGPETEFTKYSGPGGKGKGIRRSSHDRPCFFDQGGQNLAFVWGFDAPGISLCGPGQLERKDILPG